MINCLTTLEKSLDPLSVRSSFNLLTRNKVSFKSSSETMWVVSVVSCNLSESVTHHDVVEFLQQHYSPFVRFQSETCVSGYTTDLIIQQKRLICVGFVSCNVLRQLKWHFNLLVDVTWMVQSSPKDLRSSRVATGSWGWFQNVLLSMNYLNTRTFK